MSSEVKKGFLTVSDISGYTRFLAETELEHANGILKDLFLIPINMIYIFQRTNLYSIFLNFS